MIKRKLCSILTAITMTLTVAPALTASVTYAETADDASTSSAYTIPDLKI